MSIPLTLRLVGKHSELINSLSNNYISGRDVIIVKLDKFRIVYNYHHTIGKSTRETRGTTVYYLQFRSNIVSRDNKVIRRNKTT